MDSPLPHICVCICTYKRPALLSGLLAGLAAQRTDGLFTYSIVVADNDPETSGREAVGLFAESAAVPVTYCSEPERNIAMARNKAVGNARGEYIAFIDDDERPGDGWLLGLFKACGEYRADGVLGPVRPRFEEAPPPWIVKGGFFERPEHPTGYVLKWQETRTGNVLFRRDILEGDDKPFRPEFGTGSEDVEFFFEMTKRGRRFVWCAEAPVYESVPPERCTRAYLLRRAVVRGSTYPRRRGRGRAGLMKSAVAIPAYALLLPFLFLFGRHLFVRYLIKLADHSSRVMAFLGVDMAA